MGKILRLSKRMRFGTTLAIAASCALVSNVEAYSNKFLDRKVLAHKKKLERTYGPGLVGMFHEDGTFNTNSIAAKQRYIAGEPMTVTIGNLTLDATSGKAFWLGFVKGMQYAGLEKSDVANEFFEKIEL